MLFFIKERGVTHMIRGTTPTHIFTLPFDTEIVKKCRVIYSQNDEIKLKKEIDDVTLQGNSISLKLTQENTFALESTKNVEIQLRVLTVDNESLISDILTVPVTKCLDDEVIL